MIADYNDLASIIADIRANNAPAARPDAVFNRIKTEIIDTLNDPQLSNVDKASEIAKLSGYLMISKEVIKNEEA